MTIAENIARIRANMAAAAREAGRDPKEILLVGASKMNDAAACQEAIAAGIDVLGKSRQSVALVDDGQRGEQTDAGASLDTADLVHAIKPALVGDASGGRVFEAEFVEDGVDFVLRGAYFLHAPHVRRVLRCPLLDAFAFRRADSIHIRCRDCDRHSALA